MLERTVSADFSKACGRIKPFNGISLGPLFDTEIPLDLTAYYRELGVPLVRTSVAAPARHSDFNVDLSRIFPDPELDERFPESYDFSQLDRQALAIRECGAAIFLSIGESRVKYSPYAAHPFVSAEKWAKIAEKVILHLNRGWGGGHKLSVKMLEIWPGADLPGAFAGGAPAYFEFYRTVATHLKSAFSTLKIGAYSSGGFTSLNRYGATDEERGYIDFLEDFLGRVSDKSSGAPLDFFSWRCRAESAEELAIHTNYARNFLSQYGLRKTASIISELVLEPQDGIAAYSRSYPALLAAVFSAASETDISMMIYSTGYPYSRANGLYTVDDGSAIHRYSAYGVMAAYGELLRHGTEVETTDNFRREIYSIASVSESGGAMMIATVGYAGMLSVELKGSPFTKYSIKGILGGGSRGEGFSTSESDIPIGGGRFTMKVGRGEVYLITLS